jgi:hypothetical protein
MAYAAPWIYVENYWTRWQRYLEYRWRSPTIYIDPSLSTNIPKEWAVGADSKPDRYLLWNWVVWPREPRRRRQSRRRQIRTTKLAISKYFTKLRNTLIYNSLSAPIQFILVYDSLDLNDWWQKTINVERGGFYNGTFLRAYFVATPYTSWQMSIPASVCHNFWLLTSCRISIKIPVNGICATRVACTLAEECLYASGLHPYLTRPVLNRE